MNMSDSLMINNFMTALYLLYVLFLLSTVLLCALVYLVGLFQPRKLMLEKNRRARINHGLNELKGLLFQHSMQVGRQIEKADILEETIKFIKFNESKKQKGKFRVFPNINDK